MRLIDADELKRECLKLPRVLDDHFVIFVMMKDVIKTINNAPTIEAEPVRHGKWIKFHDELSKCSLCNHPIYTRWNQTDYCPNCGAKMEVLKK